MSAQGFIDGIKKVAGKYGPPQLLICTVKTVDEAALTCVVADETGEYTHVRLQALLVGEGNPATPSLVAIPEPGSEVVIGILEGHPGLACVLLTDRVAKLYLRGDAYGGLVRVEPLVESIQRLEQDINTLKQLVAGVVIVPGDGGAAIKTALTATWASNLLQPLTQVGDLANANVKHG